MSSPATLSPQAPPLSVPVRTTGDGTYEVIGDMPQNGFAQEKLALTNDELVGERDTVAELLQ